MYFMNRLLIVFLTLICVIIVFSEYAGIQNLIKFFQVQAFVIVLGGTLVSTLINFPSDIIKKALIAGLSVFKNRKINEQSTVEEIVALSRYVRKNGLLSIQKVFEQIENPFLERIIKLGLDIRNIELFYETIDKEIEREEDEELILSSVFESMGGYCPTFGIIGAVIGLIQIMGYMQDPVHLAQGISTAFVATLYGVGFANIIFLPIAGNMRIQIRDRMMIKRMILQGTVLIMLEENPNIVSEKLLAFTKTKIVDFANRQVA